MLDPLQQYRQQCDADRIRLQSGLLAMSDSEVVDETIAHGQQFQLALRSEPCSMTELQLKHSQDMMWLCAARLMPDDPDCILKTSILKATWSGQGFKYHR